MLIESALAATLTGAAGLGWSLIEARWFVLRQFTMPVLPPGAPDLRVLHLSDIHATPTQRDKLDWVRDLASLKPDLVVNTGDNLAHMESVAPVLAAHAELLDVPGVFVMGSNDYFAPKPKNPARYLLRAGGKKRIHGQRLPTEDLRRGFLEAGWLDLNNARGELSVKDQRLSFVGVDDPHLKLDRYEQVTAPADTSAALNLGITHAPYQRVLNSMTADGAEVILAGHTHGGQLCIPGFGALVTNCDLPRQQAKGVSSWTSAGPDGRNRTAAMHVSAGLGTSPYTQVRFACRPEASLITFTARPR